MKKYFLWTVLGIWTIILCSCNDDNEQLFIGTPGLHFALPANNLDSMVYSFTTTADNQIVINLPVELEGYAGDTDRSFSIKVNQEGTNAVAGKHYEALKENYLLGKGQYSMNVPVTLLYSGDLDSVSVKLTLEIVTGNDFTEGIPYREKAVIVCSNQLPTVKFWAYFYQSYFGKYSKTKHRHILGELKLKALVDDFYEIIAFNRLEWEAYGRHMNNFFRDHIINDEYGDRIEPWIN